MLARHIISFPSYSNNGCALASRSNHGACGLRTFLASPHSPTWLILNFLAPHYLLWCSIFISCWFYSLNCHAPIRPSWITCPQKDATIGEPIKLTPAWPACLINVGPVMAWTNTFTLHALQEVLNPISLLPKWTTVWFYYDFRTTICFCLWSWKWHNTRGAKPPFHL